MQRDILYYYNQVISKINDQEEKIREIIRRQSRFEQELEKLKREPKINIEHIDYQFDQLKIERLEGTLNIGMNPNDLQNLDEFFVGHPRVSLSNQQNEEIFKKVEERLNDYLKKDWPEFVEQIVKERNINVDPSYVEYIKHEVNRQLSSRISYYIQKFTMEPGMSEDHLEEKIFTTIKTDIERAVATYFNQNEKKGDTEEQ